ncbi:MAG: transposase [Chloroflexi bacterium]|nr:transposase [Chloroflexota bacterium]
MAVGAQEVILFPVVVCRPTSAALAFPVQGVERGLQASARARDAAAMGQTIEEMQALAPRQNRSVHRSAACKGADNRSPETLAEYLGRYLHAIAISNHRILHIGPEGVTATATIGQTEWRRR